MWLLSMSRWASWCWSQKQVNYLCSENIGITWASTLWAGFVTLAWVELKTLKRNKPLFPFLFSPSRKDTPHSLGGMRGHEVWWGLLKLQLKSNKHYEVQCVTTIHFILSFGVKYDGTLLSNLTEGSKWMPMHCLLLPWCTTKIPRSLCSYQ